MRNRVIFCLMSRARYALAFLSMKSPSSSAAILSGAALIYEVPSAAVKVSVSISSFFGSLKQMSRPRTPLKMCGAESHIGQTVATFVKNSEKASRNKNKSTIDDQKRPWCSSECISSNLMPRSNSLR
jgi:hypothetical protein